jgi:predicted short-subunit dehydrogenase-like oxidoreductase (DUF2520 family)
MQAQPTESTEAFAVIGQGRMGSSMAAAMRRAGLLVVGPLGRNADIGDASIVILCVPDAQIAAVALDIPIDRVVAHCSGVASLAPLAPHEAFSMHPLLTVTNATAEFAGVGCAVDASSPRAQAICATLVHALGMRSFHVADERRPLYHAAASAASNYVITVAELAGALIEQAGVQREHLVPLVRAATENWARDGASALTGPIRRGDEGTVARQREAVAKHSPESLPLWDALAAATRFIANRAGRARP